MGTWNRKYALFHIVIAVRVTKPTVPEAIAKSYEEREVERTKLLIKKEEQRLREKESEIEKKISKIQAETENKISEINNKINLAEKEANKEIASIENSIVVIKETALAKSQKCIHLFMFRSPTEADRAQQEETDSSKRVGKLPEKYQELAEGCLSEKH